MQSVYISATSAYRGEVCGVGETRSGAVTCWESPREHRQWFTLWQDICSLQHGVLWHVIIHSLLVLLFSLSLSSFFLKIYPHISHCNPMAIWLIWSFWRLLVWCYEWICLKWFTCHWYGCCVYGIGEPRGGPDVHLTVNSEAHIQLTGGILTAGNPGCVFSTKPL